MQLRPPMAEKSWCFLKISGDAGKTDETEEEKQAPLASWLLLLGVNIADPLFEFREEVFQFHSDHGPLETGLARSVDDFGRFQFDSVSMAKDMPETG